MKKLITKDRTIEFNKLTIHPYDLSNNIQDIKLMGDECIDLENLNLNIVEYEIYSFYNIVGIRNCNINKLILDIDGRTITIINSNIQNVYVQSEIYTISLVNTPLPNLHQRIDLINRIDVEQWKKYNNI